jgi:hypothetical protein
MKIDIQQMLNFNLDKVVNSTVGPIDISFQKFFIDIINFKLILNLALSNIDLQWLMENIGLDFVVLKKSLMVSKDNYIMFYFTPDFLIEQSSLNF